MTTEPTEQPARRSRCPECGAGATDESLVDHRLSDMGYLHDDQMFQCAECNHRYPHGVPIGAFDLDVSDLWCDVCDLGFMLVHRVLKQREGVKLHLKCPHHHPLDCPACGEHIPADGVRVTKVGAFTCPNCEGAIDREAVPYCFYFATASRTDDGSKSMVGYPHITGNTEHAGGRYGYKRGPDGEVVLRPDGDGDGGDP